MAECAVRVCPPAQAWATPRGSRGYIPGDHARRAVADADRLMVAWPVAPVRMGDIGEEITEIELEPLPDDTPTEKPAAVPTEPATEPVPG